MEGILAPSEQRASDKTDILTTVNSLLNSWGMSCGQ